MPRTFSFKLFIRLVGLAVLIALVCSLVAWSLAKVRHQAWQTGIAHPLMNWLAESPSPQHHYRWLAEHHDLHVGTADELELGPVARERLSYGQTLVKPGPAGQRLYTARPDGTVVTLR